MSSEQVISKTVLIQAPCSTVWCYLTRPELMQLWLSDSPIEVLSAWIPGSPIIMRGDLHGIDFENKGVILALEPEHTFAYTYLSNLSGLPDIPENHTRVAFRLTAAAPDQTTLTFTQSNFANESIYRHARFYWTTVVELIKKRAEQQPLPL